MTLDLRARLLLLLVVAGIVVRVVAMWGANEANVTPDGARFMNIARSIERGHGFSTPEAWPAWMNPERLPMPETFKEPGYPYAMVALHTVTGSLFRAGQIVSLVAGVLIPLLLYVLVRRLDTDRGVAWVAAFLAAFSPLMIQQSVYVMAESLFVALLLGAFVLAARPPRWPGAARAPWQALGAGALFGAAFLVRGQALLAAPALALLLVRQRGAERGFGRITEAAGGALVAASPLLIRNVLAFGEPLHNDAAAFGVWPYVDQLRFSHGLDRPPAPIAFAFVHIGAVLGQMAESARTFFLQTLPRDILGAWPWYVPFVAGVVLAGSRWRNWAFGWAFVAASLPFLFAVYWAPRYFASVAPVFLAFTALGTVWLWNRIPAGRHRTALTSALALVLGLLAGYQSVRAWRAVPRTYTPELAAARSEAPFLDDHLAPDEAVMADVTSYWAWFADRPAVHLVIDDEDRTREVLRRLRVRYAALPTSKLDTFAKRYPDGVLPDYLELLYEKPELDVSMFRVHDP